MMTDDNGEYKCPRCGTKLERISELGFYCPNCTKKVKSMANTLIGISPRSGKTVKMEKLLKELEAEGKNVKVINKETYEKWQLRWMQYIVG